jgi:hypothetical protein
MKLTKKEQEFLLSWLSDDLDIVKKDIERHQDNKEVMKELKPKEKIFSSIIKKLTPISKGNCHGCNETMKMDEISQKNENYCISCIN